MSSFLFSLIVFLSNIVQCITGFAGTILAMPFATMVVGFAVAKTTLNAVAVASSAGVAVTNYKNIDKKELAKICGVMLLGIGVSYLIKPYFESNARSLYVLLAVFTIGIAVLNFVLLMFNLKLPKMPLYVSIPLLFVAGLFHGMFVCGGPLLVIYAGDKFRHISQFRATLSAVWIILNSIILVTDIVQGSFTKQTTTLTLLGVAVLVAAILIGNKLAKKLSKKAFLIITYILMVISGISLLLK